METFRNFLSFYLPGVPRGVRLSRDVPRHKYSLSLSSPYRLSLTKLVDNYLLSAISLSGQTQVRSATSSGTGVGAVSACGVHTHPEDEYLSLLFLGNLVYLVVKQILFRFVFKWTNRLRTLLSTCFWAAGHFQDPYLYSFFSTTLQHM